MLKLSLAERLLQWHGGMFSGLYSVGSCMLGGHAVDPAQVDRACSELRNLRLLANFPDCVTADDEAECNALADELERLYPEPTQNQAY